MDDKEKLMAYVSFGVAAILLLLAFFGPGWKSVEETPTPGASGGSGAVAQVQPTTPAQFSARAKLAADLGIPETQISLVSASNEEWADACLGLAREGELCAQMITPGERVRLSAGGSEYTFHVSMDGNSIRIAP
ncbi:MAG TPA: hypothetical protein VLB83_03235 [Candidatus Paceibacterota bacterium]|nr:hypothetical protein [Candidatus Paceibacterota bacterium]